MADNRGTFTTNTSVNCTVTGQSSPFVTLLAAGTWGGATLKLQAGFYSDAGTLEWVDVPSGSLTADGTVSVAIAAHAIRVNCASGTAHSIKWAVLG